MPTFLHTADLHLDTAFSAHLSTSQAVIRRSEMLRCFSDIIESAKKVDLLLIAGDMFDTPKVSPETVAFLRRKFSEIPNTRVFICCGNHDPYTKSSVYAKEDFPENVHIFKDEWECVDIPELKTRIFGVSFSGEEDSSAERFSPIEKLDGVTDIILMHGDVVSAGSDSPYNPIDKSFIQNCNGDYLALGHIHKRTELLRQGKTYYAYSGVPEGRGFDECGDMGYYIGKINEGVVDVEFRRACVRRMLKVDADISGASDSYDALSMIKKAVFDQGNENDMYKLSLSGRISSDLISFDVIEKEIKDMLYYVEIIDNTKEDYDIDLLEQQNSLCGEFVRHMNLNIKELDGDDREVMEDALLLGINVLTGGDTL